jgi:hypothetical protein
MDTATVARRVVRWASVCLALVAAPASATDTAFWQPYAHANEETYALFSFDDPLLRNAEGKIAAIDVLGEAAADPAGKFGGALRIGSKGALKATPSAIFPGGSISIEAWVKLDAYPEKEGYIVYRPAKVDSDTSDPAVNATKGFALLIDSAGTFHLETVNPFYGRRTRTSSPAGVVPLHQWVHLAGISAEFPIGFRRLYLDGREVVSVPIASGQGLMTGSDEEHRSGPLYVGNTDNLDAGITGLMDQVRIHRRIVKFWEREDNTWTPIATNRPIPMGPPHFLATHPPILYLPLDGQTDPVVSTVPNLKIKAEGGRFVPGVRGQGWRGPIALSAPNLLDLHEGSVEFWVQPLGANNYSDMNWRFVEGPFTFYIFNSARISRKALTIYFRKDAGDHHFVSDGLGTEFHPGAWYHFVIAWRAKDITLYVNGQQAGRTYDQSLVTAANRGVSDALAFSPYGHDAVVDEVYSYDKALLPEEAANAFLRYRDPAKLKVGVLHNALDLKGLYYPSYHRIEYELTPNVPTDRLAGVSFRLANSRNEELMRKDLPGSALTGSLTVPALADDTYTLSVSAVAHDGSLRPGGMFRFVRRRFIWENNTLGITNAVYPPFTPLAITGREVHMVGRVYTMNGFGLWDHVVTLGRDILAAPMRLRFITSDGEGAWDRIDGAWVTTEPNEAVYRAEATSAAVVAKTRATLDVDGSMKVEMDLLPGAHPAEIRFLWLEIPLRNAEVPLMHTIGDGLRQNYSGGTPAGEGHVWDGSRCARSAAWRNDFVPYIWLGGEERGLSWFGENDRGWITKKGKSKTPTHTLVRDGNTVHVKVYFINQPATLMEAHHLVFGLQASPTKPMPADWRKRLPYAPGGLPVVPWGGLQCASQGPFRDDWRIVDKILERRAGKPFDKEWFETYVRENKPPLAFGTWNWLSSVDHFAGIASRAGLSKPMAVYHEEMAAATSRPEWAVFQDEWTDDPYRYTRRWLDPDVMARGYSAVADAAGVTFVASYRDFGSWFANEWLKRGLSLYWDNTFPHLSSNVRTTAAYVAEDGYIQPALILWNQREYQKRVWQLLQQWRRVRPEPLEWTLHMTNTQVLPIHTWGTINLDHELGHDGPFSPAWLRTETIGRQTGNLPLSLYPVSGRRSKMLAKLAKTTPRTQLDKLVARIEWGMRAVHEIQRDGPLEHHLTDFGYGTDAVRVHNYWEEEPALTVVPESVKWLALAEPKTQRLLIVLQSWAADDTEAAVGLNEAPSGSIRRGTYHDAETGEEIAPAADGRLNVTLARPYGVRVLTFGPTAVKE